MTNNSAVSSSDTPQQPQPQQPQPRLVIGLDCCCCDDDDTAIRALGRDAAAALNAARPDGYDYVTTRILLTDDDDRSARTDVAALESKWWRTSVVGVLDVMGSSSMDNNSSTNNKKRTTMETRIAQGLEWSVHMNLPAIWMPSPASLSGENNNDVFRYAAAVTRALPTLRDTQLWIPVSLDSDDDSTAFDCFYRLTGYHPSIHACLVLEPMPLSTNTNISVYVADLLRRLHVWIGAAPVAAVVLPTDMFLTNKRGFPTLSRRRTRWSCRRCCSASGAPSRCWCGPTTSTSLSNSSSSNNNLTPAQLGTSQTLPHWQYLQHFRRSRAELTRSLDTATAHMEHDYLDSLQSPLQPLADHLENETYEVFEKDPVKYARYQQAVLRALQEHGAEDGKFCQSTTTT